MYYLSKSLSIYIWSIWLQMVLERNRRNTCRRQLSERRDALSGHDWVNLEMHLEAEIELNWEMHLEAEIERTQRCTWRLRSSNFEMHLEAVIKQFWRCTWRLCSCELGGHDRASLEMHLDAKINGDWGSTWRWSIQDGRLEGRHDGSWDSIHWLTPNGGNVESWVQQGPPRDERLAGSGRQSILGRCCTHGVCSTRCMLYSVYAVLGVNSWSLHGEIERDDLASYS